MNILYVQMHGRQKLKNFDSRNLNSVVGTVGHITLLYLDFVSTICFDGNNSSNNIFFLPEMVWLNIVYGASNAQKL